MPRANPDKTRCGAETRTGGTCQQVAGMGTDHPGVGRCKYHGGCTPIKTGLYSKIVSAEEAEEFRQFEVTFDMLQPSKDEIFLMFRMMKYATGQLTDAKSVGEQAQAVEIGLEALAKFSLVRSRYKQVLKGDDINIHFDMSIADDICEAVAEVLCDFLPPDQRAEAENRIFSLVAEKMAARGPD